MDAAYAARGSRFEKTGDAYDDEVEGWSSRSNASVDFATYMDTSAAPTIPNQIDSSNENVDQVQLLNVEDFARIYNAGFGGGSNLYQSFTPGISGFITRIELPLQEQDYPVAATHPFMLSIISQDSSGRFDPDSPKASTLVHPEEVDFNPTMVSISFGSPTFLNGGSQYLIELKSEWVGGWASYKVIFPITSTYEGGAMCDFNYALGTCEDTRYDIGFKTYMVPAVSPRPSEQPTAAPTPTPSDARSPILSSTEASSHSELVTNQSITKKNAIRFESGSSKLSKGLKNDLKNAYRKSGQSGVFVITGCAGLKNNVSRKKVENLAKQRALAVKRYLIKLGVTETRIEINTRVVKAGVEAKVRLLTPIK